MQSMITLPWTPALTDKVVSAVLDLAKVAFGAGLTWLLTSHTQKKAALRQRARRLSQLKIRIASQPIANYIANDLMQLREFFIEHHELLFERTENFEFWRKWLNDPSLSLMAGATGYWTKEKLQDMLTDLGRLNDPAQPAGKLIG